LIIAELKLYKPYAMPNTVKINIFLFKLVQIVLKKTFSTSNFSQSVTLFLVPALILKSCDMEHGLLELLKIFTCGLLNLYAKHGEIIKKNCMFVLEL